MSDQRRDEMDRAWGDAVYDAWRRGLKSDLVSRDSMADYAAAGYEPSECAAMEVNRIARRRQLSDEEQMDQDLMNGAKAPESSATQEREGR